MGTGDYQIKDNLWNKQNAFGVSMCGTSVLQLIRKYAQNAKVNIGISQEKMKKHTNLYNEIEIGSDTYADRIWMGIGIFLLILALIAIIWTPDVEAIGAWVYKLIN